MEWVIKLGGTEWKKGDKHRIYFDSDVVNEIAGWKIGYYNTGNISWASFQGEDVSNTFARKNAMTGAERLYYDVKTKKWVNWMVPEVTFNAFVERMGVKNGMVNN